MFNFFKKKENPHQQSLVDFQERFTKEQRAAMLGCLVVMAKSDGEAHPKELQIVEQARKLLGVEMGDPVFNTIAGGSKEMMIAIINTLEKAQKDWFVATLHSVILADGKVERSETTFMKGFCQQIGISEFDYLVITNR